MARKTYTVKFEHGDRPHQWIASVQEIPQCHTFGRGLAQTRARIREALILWEGEKAESAEIREVLPLPKATQKRIEKVHALKDRMHRLADEARARQEAIVRTLLDSWSMRDIGEVLDISHQRVNQVTTKRRRRRATADSK